VTLLRRAPREVYRVYGEDEFWASSERELLDGGNRVGRTDATASAAGRRPLRRMVVSTALLAGAGAVGGLMAVTGAAPSPHATQRAVAGVLARDGFVAAPRAGGVHIWRERASSHVSRSRAAWARRVARGVSAGGPASAPTDGVAGTVAPRAAHAIGPTDPGAPIEVAAVSVSSRPVPIESPAGSVDTPSASAPAQPSSPGRSEFGFER
jgi:hypothetical protein